MKITSIKYLSQGKNETGGYRHELSLFNNLLNYFNKSNPNIKSDALRIKKSATNIFSYLQLMGWYFIHTNASVNILPVRGAISAIARNLFNSSKNIVVIHSDVQPYSSKFLKAYYSFFLWIITTIKPSNTAIVVVCKYWENIFLIRGSKNVFNIPNLFDNSYYQKFITQHKKKKIHLGMSDPKLDTSVYELAKQLKKEGYECYFSTLNKELVAQNENYSIKYFQSFDSYLTEVSESLCTLQMPAINEGWPRLAHESLLVGTPVIGYKKGGLGDLLTEGNCCVVSNIYEAKEIILANLSNPIKDDFLEKYDLKNIDTFLAPLIDWIEN